LNVFFKMWEKPRGRPSPGVKGRKDSFGTNLRRGKRIVEKCPECVRYFYIKKHKGSFRPKSKDRVRTHRNAPVTLKGGFEKRGGNLG